MNLMRILTYIDVFAPWLYLAGILGLIWGVRRYNEARRNRLNSIFGIEREFGLAEENRLRMFLYIISGSLGLLTLLKVGVFPNQTLPPLHEPTPTRFVIEVPTGTPAPPTPTRTRLPTRPPATSTPEAPPTPRPTAVPTRVPVLCANPGICISSPVAGQPVSGSVNVVGTASIDRFQFFKLEYGLGANPDQFHVIGDLRRSPVVNGTLGTWNTAGFPPGPAVLRLTVVDETGNFPKPFDVPVVIQ